MRWQPLIRCVLSCLVVVSFGGESYARGWRRVRCCAPQPVVCCVTYAPVCGFAPAYPYGGSAVVDRPAPPPAPPRDQAGAPGGRSTEMLRGDAGADPPPPPPESTGAPAPAPQPTLSPRDIQPDEPEESEEPAAPATDDAAAADTDTDEDFGQILGAEPTEQDEPAEDAAVPGPSDPFGEPAPTTPDTPAEQPEEATETPDIDLPPNPFGRLDALPTLLPGGVWSREFRRWVDNSDGTQFKARLSAIGGGSVRLVKEDGSIAEVALVRLSRRDVAFVAVQVRALASTAALDVEEIEDAPRGLLAAAHAWSNADATVGVAR